MNNKLIIPNNIVVGYCKREDTYTGKLGFVVYKDEKGDLRQEKSWDGWRDHKINPDEHDNEPATGFVLNKDAGGARRSYGWNARVEKVRVFDPRGWEFEIDVKNLLFILQHCSSIKGKGLDGEFVYAWSGSNVILLPTECEEYRSSIEFTAAKSKKVEKKEMVPGCIYKTKEMNEVMYLGRYEYFNSMNISYSFESEREGKKQHVFLRTNSKPDKPRYETFPGFTKLAERLAEEPSRDFADKLEKFLNGPHHVVIDHIEFVDKPHQLKKKKVSYDEGGWYSDTFVVHDGVVCSADIRSPIRKKYNYDSGKYDVSPGIICSLCYQVKLGEKGQLPYFASRPHSSHYENQIEFESIEELDKIRVDVVAVLNNGKRIILKKC